MRNHRFFRNILGPFVALFLLLDAIAIIASRWLSGVDLAIKAWERLETRIPSISKIPEVTYTLIPPFLALTLTILTGWIYYSREKRKLYTPRSWDPPMSHFYRDEYLEFCYINEPREIIELAETENYGSRGKTDVSIVTKWWAAYKYGNVIAKYRGKIIGGIDIWPLRKKTYQEILSGQLGDEDLRADHFSTRRLKYGSYWYAASVSLAAVWRQKRERRELLLRLLINAFELWLSRAPNYPAHISAIAWTIEGKNYLHHLGFKPHIDSKHPDPEDTIYTITFTSIDDAIKFIDQQKARIIDKSQSNNPRQD